MNLLNIKCQDYISLLENNMKEILKEGSILYDSMRYSINAGGKRLRPLLMFSVGELLSIDVEDIIPYATAIEFIHTYSLIHDDLPAMDNDDLRRGKPTNHIVYGENMAILAGDGLLNLSMDVVIEQALKKPTISNLKAMRLLFNASGTKGMIEGQAKDIKNENCNITTDELKEINDLKTGKLISASILIPYFLSEQDENIRKKLETLSQKLGLAYQIKDDLLDVVGVDIGKPTGSDMKNMKKTYVNILGIDKAERYYEEICKEIYNILDSLCSKEHFLYMLIDKVLYRNI